jgi:hypothetical protein
LPDCVVVAVTVAYGPEDPRITPGGLEMRSRTGERGDGRLSFLFWIVVLGLAALVGFETVPVRWRMAQLQDFMVESAERARFGNEKQIKRAIMFKATELDLPLEEKELFVEIKAGRIKIDAQYMVTLDFPFYTWDWHKRHEVTRTIYYW